MPQRNKFEDESGDLRLPGDDEPAEVGDEEAKPDWLLTAEHGVEAFQPEEEGPASGPVLKRPGDGGTITPSAGTPRPRIVPNPKIPSPADQGRLDGLVGHEVPAGSPRTLLPDRTEQMGHSKQMPRPVPMEPPASGPPVPTWSAVSSSVPTLRSEEATEEPDAVVVRDDEEWEAEEEEAKPVASRAPTARRPTAPPPPPPKPALPFPVPAAIEGPATTAWNAIEPILHDHGRSLAVLGGCVVVLIIALNIFVRPKEPATSLRDLIRDASVMDGKEVRISGVIGQWFPMGDGFSFYLHQGRDTIVVFTRVRTPAEKQKVNVLGTVSTGYLDGRPRPTLFETRLN